MPYAKRGNLPGFPKEMRFQTRAEVDAYLAPAKVACLLCGRSFKILDTHLRAVHGVTSDDYREKYGLPYLRGLCGSGFSERKVELGRALFEENTERQTVALQRAHEVQRAAGGNPQRRKPDFWCLEVLGRKLEPSQIVSIRKDSRATRAIAEAYGVTVSNIYNIKKNQTWKHLRSG